LRQILAIHTAAEDTEAINETNARIEAQAVENAKKKQLERRRMMRRTAQKPRMTKAEMEAKKRAHQAEQRARRQAAQAAQQARRQAAQAAQQARRQAKQLAATKRRKIQ
jgi:colicin import membrane protein